MEDDFDLYDDLITDKNSAQEEEQVSKAEVDRWREQLEESEAKLKRLMKVNHELKQKYDTLETNFSSLIKTSRNEINRKNDTIAGLRRELDDVIFHRIFKQGNAKSSEIKTSYERLKKLLNDDSNPTKLLAKEGIIKAKPKNKTVNITHFSAKDVCTIKFGNTSFTNMVHGDVKEAKHSVLAIEQRKNVATSGNQIPSSKEIEENQQNNSTKESDYKSEQGLKKANTSTRERRRSIESDSRNKSYKKPAENREKKREEKSRSSIRSDGSRQKTDSSNRRSAKESSTDRDRSRSSRDRSARESTKSRRDSASSTKSSSTTRKESSSSRRSSDKKSDSKSNQSAMKSGKKGETTKGSEITKERSDSQKCDKNETASCSTEMVSALQTDDYSQMDSNDIENLLEAKQREYQSLIEQQNSILTEAECEDDIILKVDQQQQKDKATKTPEQPVQSSTSVPASQSLPDPKCQETTPDKHEVSINGLISTKEFLGDWNFPQSQYKTPPSKVSRNLRSRTDSETSSASTNIDFTSASGISAVLKGKLVPGSSISPSSGMIKTPTPSKDKTPLRRPPKEQEIKLNRTRNKSKELAKELQHNEPDVVLEKKALKENKPSTKSLVSELGLDISSSENEASPIKRNLQQRKRKKPTLGFSSSNLPVKKKFGSK